MPPCGADLLFDQVEIVEQPFGRRRHPPALLQCRRHQIICVNECAVIFIEARNELVGRSSGGKCLLAGKFDRVLLELFGAEQFRAERRINRRRVRRAVSICRDSKWIEASNSLGDCGKIQRQLFSSDISQNQAIKTSARLPKLSRNILFAIQNFREPSARAIFPGNILCCYNRSE